MLLALHPAGNLTLGAALEGLWRTRSQDAFYAAPGIPLVVPNTDHARFSGTEGQVKAEWGINRFLDLTAAYVHFEPAAFLRAAHARSQDFGMAEVSVQY